MGKFKRETAFIGYKSFEGKWGHGKFWHTKK
jgi:hypothetical protein